MIINKILCIDDDEIVQFINSTLIRRMLPEVNVDTAMNGKSALDFFEHIDSNVPDLVLLDLNMPVMNGWKFLEVFESQHHNRYPDTYIAILSSTIDREDQVKAEKYPSVKKFIPKPLTEKVLIEVLDEIKQ